MPLVNLVICTHELDCPNCGKGYAPLFRGGNWYHCIPTNINAKPEWQFPLLATKFIRLGLLSEATREPMTARGVRSVCTHKVGYRSAASVKVAAAECIRKYGSLGLEAYECPCCDSYHVGHPNIVRPAMVFNEDCITAIRKLAPDDMTAARRFVVYSYRFNKDKVDGMPISAKTERSRRCIEAVKVQTMVVLSLREKGNKDAERLPD